MVTYSYNNYIYTLFITEFAFELRKHKNKKIRDGLENILNSKKQIDRRLIKELMKKHENDYKTIINLLSINHHVKVSAMIKHMMFEFDMSLLKKLRDMKSSNRISEIEKIMKPYIEFTTKKVDISNIIASCKTEVELKQCNRGKLLMDKDNFMKCCKLLSNDLDNPYIYETIALQISDVLDQLKFVKRKTEILSIKTID